MLPAAHRHVDPLRPEILENKLASQKEEIEQLVADNHQLASTHVALKRDLAAVLEETERVKEHIQSIRTESDIQIRLILDKMGKKEGDIQASERVRNELQQSINEAKQLASTIRELSAKITRATEELEKARSEVRNLPQMQAELDKLQEEHRKLRKTFEHEKGLNVAQVEEMKLMELDLVGKTSEVERLQAELSNAERKVQQANEAYNQRLSHQIPPPVHNAMTYPVGFGRPPLGSSMDTHPPIGEGSIPYGVGSANFAWRQQGPY